MGNCCDTNTKDEERPILSFRPGPVGVRSGTLSQPTAEPPVGYRTNGGYSPITEEPGRSARQHNPVRDRKEFETSIEMIAPVHMKTIPLTSIDKTFQDLSRLYNEIVENFQSLEKEIHMFKESFSQETHGIPVLADCVNILYKRLGGANITVERKTKNFIELKYDRQEVSKSCDGNEEDTLLPLDNFSSACRHIRNVLSNAPQVEANVRIILQDDEKLRKDIMKSDLAAADMQHATKTFLDNVSKMRVVAAGTDTLKRDAEKKFKEFAKASEGFFEREPVSS